MNGAPFPAPALAALREATKAYLGIAGSGDDALLDTLGAAALGFGEGLIGQSLIDRAFVAVLPASAGWQRLSATPVTAIVDVAAVPLEGAAVPLPPTGYAIDIDARGDGWVRVIDAAGAARVQVGYTAGMAAEWAALPPAIRQGAVRLTAHLHQQREDDAAVPPAAVTALWRPWRRMRIAEARR